MNDSTWQNRKHVGLAARTLLRARGRQASGTDVLGGIAVPDQVETALRHRRGTGAQLPSALARDMQTAFGADFSAVRVHADSQAAQFASQLQAAAFAYGTDLYFSAGSYRPGSPVGVALLAHELAHVVQPHRATQGSGPATIGRADDPAERAADALAAAVFSEYAATEGPERSSVALSPVGMPPSAATPRRSVRQWPTGSGIVVERMTETEPESEAVSWPPVQWEREINRLRQGNNLLGPSNGAFKPMLKKTGVEDCADQLVKSLNAPEAGADQAKDLLLQLYTLCKTEKDLKTPTAPGKPGGSRLPTLIYNDLHEIINAKRLWLRGDRRLHPWPYNAEALKPDYVVADEAPQSEEGAAAAFYTATAEVGDHVKVTGVKQPVDLVARFGDQVTKKLMTYKHKHVRVVVDLTDNEAAHAADIPRDDLSMCLGAKLGALRADDRERLTQVDAVLPEKVLTFDGRDWAHP